uniref:dedicator of cytokinesis protein 4-like isoform X2 n=1 Tax=Panthera onca TaxID=9690 RepID=UPI0029558540|nr:dedicator of cytokinesis protein 4-like isoform X2 [Panthera onca]XP_060484070.1 dedicator of cytokinesis protein 4-like isoform X2 [Panthera onca]
MRPLHKKLVDQFFVMKSSLGIQEFSACIQASPVHFPNGSPRVCRNSAPASMSPDGTRVIPRRSPLSYPAVNRYSSSSLSSQASAEPSPSTSSLSSTHSASPNVTSSAPSSARASPLLSDKHKHSRENSCLSPRERPCSAIYPTPGETSQVVLVGRRYLENKQMPGIAYMSLQRNAVPARGNQMGCVR